jgi:hypothetical protein
MQRLLHDHALGMEVDQPGFEHVREAGLRKAHLVGHVLWSQSPLFWQAGQKWLPSENIISTMALRASVSSGVVASTTIPSRVFSVQAGPGTPLILQVQTRQVPSGGSMCS